MCIRDRPLITAPNVITALYLPVLANFKAAIGISKAPGTLTTSISVSYTHLDVYKRQMLGVDFSLAFNKQF